MQPVADVSLIRHSLRRGQFALALASPVALAAAAFAVYPLGYVAVTATIAFIAFIWLWRGAQGLPTLPAAGAIYYASYALPLMRGQPGLSPSVDGDGAGFSVALFLLCACMTWALIGHRSKPPISVSSSRVSSRRYNAVIFIGYAIGISFCATDVSGFTNDLGPYYAVVHDVALTSAALSCYMTGYGSGRRFVTGLTKQIALFCFLLLVMLNIVSLYLYGAATLILTMFLGYIISAQRIPVKSLAVAIVAISVLNAGKADMRNAYWPTLGGDRQFSLSETPELLVEWAEIGMHNIAVGAVSEDSVFERASLIRMVVIAEREAPTVVPFLEGQTYLYLLDIIVPRFLNPEKVNSQMAASLMSVHFGLQTWAATRSTNISWGPVAEGYANFGIAGIIGAGLVFGVLAGLVARLSIGAAADSRRMLIAIAATTAMLLPDYDLGYMILNMMHAAAAALLLTIPLSAIGLVRLARRSKPQFGYRRAANVGSPLV
jgi:hypothetical protein